MKCLSASRNSLKFRLSQNVSPQNHENSVKNSSTNANARTTLSSKTNSIRVQVMFNSFCFIIEERPNVQCPTYRATKETCAQGKLFARREQNLWMFLLKGWTKFILNYPPIEVSYVNRLDQLNLLPLDFCRQMHDLVLLFKYKTGTVATNFGRFIQTAAWQYRTRNFHQANFDLLSRHNQGYYCNSSFPRTVKLWNSLPNILKSSQDLLWFRVHLNDHFRGLLQTYSPP